LGEMLLIAPRICISISSIYLATINFATSGSLLSKGGAIKPGQPSSHITPSWLAFFI
jgi:hypothetical protein